MLYKIIETAIKHPEMESFDEFFNRVSGYDIGEGRIIKEVYKTLNELQKLALTQYIEYLVESGDDDNIKKLGLNSPNSIAIISTFLC